MNGYACSDHNGSPSLRLDVFKAMFSKAESKEVDEASLTIDCKPDILSSFLHFLYNDHGGRERFSYQGVIIVCHQKGINHDPCDVIKMSRTGVREMVNNDNDNACHG